MTHKDLEEVNEVVIGFIMVDPYFGENGLLINVHEYADENRDLTESEYDALRQSMINNPDFMINNPINIDKNGKLLDGRNRIKIAKELGITTFNSIQYLTEDNSKLYSLFVSNNISRQLTHLDLSLLACKLFERIEDGELEGLKKFIKEDYDGSTIVYCYSVYGISEIYFRAARTIYFIDKTIFEKLAGSFNCKYITIQCQLTRKLLEIATDLKLRKKRNYPEDTLKRIGFVRCSDAEIGKALSYTREFFPNDNIDNNKHDDEFSNWSKEKFTKTIKSGRVEIQRLRTLLASKPTNR